MVRRRLGRGAAVLSTLGAISLPLAAQEVSLTVPPDTAESLREALEASSLTLSIAPEDDASAPQDYVAAAGADYRRLLTALYAEGHYGGTISIRVDGREASTIEPLDAPERIGRIDIAVDPGPLFRFGRAGIAPVAPPDGRPETELPDAFATGEPARAGIIRDAARAGIDGWRYAGHPLARVSAEEITAIHPDERLDAQVGLEPGPQLSFGEVTVSGNAAVRTERILAIAGIRRELYDPDEVTGAETRLRRIPAFAAAAIVEAEAPGPNGTLPLEIQVEEALPRRIGFGAEIATEDGLSLTAFWLHRNLLGGAESLRLDAEATGIGGATGGPDYRLGAEFVRPATFRRDTDLTFRTALERTEEEDYLADQFSAELTLKRFVNDDFTLEGGPGFLITRETRDGVELDYELLTFPLRATLDRRDNDLDARSGFYADVALTPFFGSGDTSAGVRLYADGRYYRSFGADDRVTLAARAQVGSVYGPDLIDVPSDYLFYSGGGGTVRGQPYQSLGVTTNAGGAAVETGGASFLGAQVEARVRITERIGAVAFYDYGTVSAEAIPGGASPWHAGAGIGARYQTPIGPIRLDIGTPASGDTSFKDVQVYIGIGQAF